MARRRKSRPKALHVFISYQQSSEPDASIAMQVYQALAPDHEVFIDRKIPAGVQWARYISQELESADVLIVLLSETSIQSEFVTREIETAIRMARRSGKPFILPVRLGYDGRLPYQLAVHLDSIQHLAWRTPEDTPMLVEAIQRTLERLPSDATQFQQHQAAVSHRPSLYVKIPTEPPGGTTSRQIPG